MVMLLLTFSTKKSPLIIKWWREKCTKHLGPLGWLKLVCFPQTTKNALCSSSWFFIDCDVFEEKYEQEITKRRKKWSWYCYSFCHKFNQHKRQHHIRDYKKLGSSVAWVTSLKSQGHFEQVSDKVTAKYLYLYSPVFLYLAAQHIIGLHLAYIVPPPDCLPYFPRDEGVCTGSTSTAPFCRIRDTSSAALANTCFTAWKYPFSSSWKSSVFGNNSFTAEGTVDSIAA